MTLPFPGDEVTGPIKGRRNWLLRLLGVQEKYEGRIRIALADAAEDAEESIRKRLGDNRIGASARRYQLREAQKAIRSTFDILFPVVREAVSEGQHTAAVAAVEAGLEDDSDVLDRLFKDPKRRKAFETMQKQAADRGVEAMMARVLVSHKPLSERVYNTRALASGQVDRIVNSALARGDSAADIAKAVRGSIDPNTPGGVAYAAKRLGRTEINNAFHAQSIADVQEKPWVKNVEWRLSKVHVPQGCKCEKYAKLKSFTTETIPDRPHPNCMCYIVPVLIPWQDFESNLLAGLYRAIENKV